MSKPERPTTLRGGNSAYPEWDKVCDDEQADCDACEGYGWDWGRDGQETCAACRGTGKEAGS